MAPIIVDEDEMVDDPHGYGIAVRSGPPQNGTLPNPAVPIGATTGGASELAEGYGLPIGDPASQQFRPVRADITALDVGNGMVHLQSQYRVHEGSGGGSY